MILHSPAIEGTEKRKHAGCSRWHPSPPHTHARAPQATLRHATRRSWTAVRSGVASTTRPCRLMPPRYPGGLAAQSGLFLEQPLDRPQHLVQPRLRLLDRGLSAQVGQQFRVVRLQRLAAALGALLGTQGGPQPRLLRLGQ